DGPELDLELGALDGRVEGELAARVTTQTERLVRADVGGAVCGLEGGDDRVRGRVVRLGHLIHLNVAPGGRAEIGRHRSLRDVGGRRGRRLVLPTGRK